MGNVNDTIRDHIEREFHRVKKSDKRNYLTIDEAKRLKSLEDMPVNFKKLAVLFMLDVDKNGKFSLQDLLTFADWCASVTSDVYENKYDQQTFLSELQAQCTLAMWRQVCHTQLGHRAFTEWFTRLFSVGMWVRIPHYPEIPFVKTDTIATLHEILSIQELYGLNCQSLIDLMQNTAEEMGLLRLDDESLDNVIPLKIVEVFAENFIQGFLNMMTQLDFTPDRYLKPFLIDDNTILSSRGPPLNSSRDLYAQPQQHETIHESTNSTLPTGFSLKLNLGLSMNNNSSSSNSTSANGSNSVSEPTNHSGGIPKLALPTTISARETPKPQIVPSLSLGVKLPSLNIQPQVHYSDDEDAESTATTEEEDEEDEEEEEEEEHS